MRIFRPIEESGSRSRRTARDGASRGFSLIELLVVIAIVGIMAMLAIPAVTSIGDSHAMSQAVSDVSGLIEYARTEAVARNTYVWVGFFNSTGAAGGAELCVAAFHSKDGTPAAAGGIGQLSKLIRAKNVKLVQGYGGGALSGEIRDLLQDEAGTFDVETNPAPVSLADHTDFKAGLSAGGITFNRTLTITPQGEAMLEKNPSGSQGFDNIVDIGLKRMKGATESTSPDDAAIWLYGSSGRLRVFRLQ